MSEQAERPDKKKKKPASKKAGGEDAASDAPATGESKMVTLRLKGPGRGSPVAAEILSWLEQLTFLSLYAMSSKEALYKRKY